ncbi:hypothetical protein CJ179_38880 [Rhodococcus sp. ACS1]|uniref:ribose-phosphate pyrophosphokinase n=1 Tax=Rhodococcus sp. ACS1 TaxID=2028570 RepID=UPI000BB105AE|nr:ribose-phosphate pyrophosphokinase [Rhodococcus sp. ACS1]PBC38562.1 hypothetical protein CJ179_38880 [Rhodococcus sp. ACS1]
MIDFYAQVGGRVLPSSDLPLRFPAGEQHITDHPYDDETPLYVVIRGTDANDYISAAMWIDLQRQRGFRVAAIIPYLPGARQDRGKPFGAQVYARLINAMSADQVITFDPHSPVMPGLINNLTVVDSTEAVLKGLSGHALALDGIIAPDAGARNRAAKVAAALNLPVYTGSKKRNSRTGELTDFECEYIPDRGGRFLIVDDICDGGRTFIGLANAAALDPEQLVLWVSHGVFSGRYGHLLQKRFDHIFTTDSHPGHRNEDVGAWIVPVLPYLTKEISL